MENEETNEKGFEVEDKRRVNADGTLRDGQEDSPKTEEVAEEHDHSGHDHDHEPMMPPDVYSVLELAAGLLMEQAWIHMGIRLAPGEKELKKDLVQAKIAIDTIAFVTDKLNDRFDESSRKAIRTMVSDLQLNYVKQSS